MMLAPENMKLEDVTSMLDALLLGNTLLLGFSVSLLTGSWFGAEDLLDGDAKYFSLNHGCQMHVRAVAGLPSENSRENTRLHSTSQDSNRQPSDFVLWAASRSNVLLVIRRVNSGLLVALAEHGA